MPARLHRTQLTLIPLFDPGSRLLNKNVSLTADLYISWIYSCVFSFTASRRSYLSQPRPPPHQPGSGGNFVIEEFSCTGRGVWYILNVDEGREGHRYTSRCQVRRETAQQMCGLFYNGTGLLGIDLSGHCGPPLQAFDSLFEVTNSRGLYYK